MNEEINLTLLLRWLLKRWKIISLFTVLGIALGVVYSVFAERVYRVDVVVTSTSDANQSSLANLTGSLGGLVGLGSNLFSDDGSLNESIALLQSRTITAELIEEEKLLPVLFAEDTDPKTGKWIVDEADQPTIKDAIDYFIEDIRRVHRDRDLGLITVSVLWTDPDLAAEWANQLIHRVNQRMRSRAVDEATKNLEYLKEELSRSQNLESQQIIAGLMQANLNSAAMANAKREYAFRIIDPAFVPDLDDYVSPRPVIAIVGLAIIGFLLGAGAAGLSRSGR